jgi:hypothetical protein
LIAIGNMQADEQLNNDRTIEQWLNSGLAWFKQPTSWDPRQKELYIQWNYNPKNPKNPIQNPRNWSTGPWSVLERVEEGEQGDTLCSSGHPLKLWGTITKEPDGNFYCHGWKLDKKNSMALGKDYLLWLKTKQVKIDMQEDSVKWGACTM